MFDIQGKAWIDPCPPRGRGVPRKKSPSYGGCSCYAFKIFAMPLTHPPISSRRDPPRPTRRRLAGLALSHSLRWRPAMQIRHPGRAANLPVSHVEIDMDASSVNGHARLPSSGVREDSLWETIFLAYRTLGVVFGGLVTSPLYVYPSMNLKSPTENDYLGILCIMFWTLTLIGVVKYVCIALNADDHGEGGTFALYSLLCRHLNVGYLANPTQQVDRAFDLQNSRGRNAGAPSRLGRIIEKSVVARRVLLFMAMLGTCMLIGDGVLTPAISVLSAMDGLSGPFPAVNKSIVDGASALVLIILFLMQKFGTSRVSFLFSPIMAAWTFTTPIIGLYSIIRYYPGIFKAFSPHYAYYFFVRNGKEGWLRLGETVLCITGSEAMFADLGHFSRSSIQIAFLFTIYPSLVLTYSGQTAYLVRNPGDYSDGFYKFVPRAVYWPMFIIATSAAIVASQSLISATFSVIKQSVVLGYFPRVKVVHTSPSKEGEVYSPEVNYILMALCVAVVLGFGDGKDIGNAFGVVVILVMLITTLLLTLVMTIIWRTHFLLVGLYFVVFFTLEGVYVSAVFTKIPEGGWFPFAISIILAFVMYGWYHGRQKKMDYETAHKITLERLKSLLAEPGIQRVPGLCFFYSNIQNGFTPVLGHYVKNMRSLHRVTIFTTLRYFLVAKVPPQERIVVKRLGIRGVYSCIIQYGYADSLDLEGDLVGQVVISLQAHLQNISNEVLSNTASMEEDVSELAMAKEEGIVHVRGKIRFHIDKSTGWFDKTLLVFYEILHSNCRSSLPASGMPLQQRMEVGMLYEA